MRARGVTSVRTAVAVPPDPDGSAAGAAAPEPTSPVT